jgi:flagellar FliL protein
MAAEAEIEGGTAAKKGKGKLVIIVAAAVVVLLGGAGLYLFLSAGKSADAAADAALAAPQTFIFNLPTMTVNLNNETDGEAFMKLTVALEVANEEMMTKIQPSMAKVVDAFQVYLRELRKSDLEGSAALYRLKEELLRRINQAVFPAKVDAVLFNEILIQ